MIGTDEAMDEVLALAAAHLAELDQRRTKEVQRGNWLAAEHLDRRVRRGRAALECVKGDPTC